jgi:cardiolipin synthase
MKNLPNILTLSRIAIIPFVILAMLGGLNHLALVLFVIAGITDFFDGYLARKFKTESKWGAMLDPIADKLLVAAVLVLITRQLSGFDAIAVIVILLREVLVSGLREYLGQQKISMPVTKLAKWKTAVQFVAISALLYEINLYSECLLWAAATITAITGAKYTKYAIEKLTTND